MCVKGAFESISSKFLIFVCYETMVNIHSIVGSPLSRVYLDTQYKSMLVGTD